METAIKSDRDIAQCNDSVSETHSPWLFLNAFTWQVILSIIACLYVCIQTRGSDHLAGFLLCGWQWLILLIMVRQGLLLHQACDSVSGGRESDLISINCEGPAGMLGAPYGFWALCPRGPAEGPNQRDSQVHTLAVKWGETIELAAHYHYAVSISYSESWKQHVGPLWRWMKDTVTWLKEGAGPSPPHQSALIMKCSTVSF